jgi:hypothetical protein
MNELIPRINIAISECKKRETKMEAEMLNIMPQLEKAHYISADVIHLIERKYNEKIENVREEIESMEAHVKEMEING